MVLSKDEAPCTYIWYFTLGREGRAGGELGVCLMNISVAYKCQWPKCE